MIALLRGTLAEKQPDQIVLDVGGVGYRVFIALSTYETLPDLGEQVRLLILTYVREDAFHLYGFVTQEEKSLFVLLNNVNGVGNRLALSALSALTPQALVTAIISEDLAMLCRIPGIGRKIAQRLVIELKDRLPPALLVGVQNNGTATTGLASGGQPKPQASSALLRREISSALLNLGYKLTEVESVLTRIMNNAEITSVGEGIRAALKELSRQVTVE